MNENEISKFIVEAAFAVYKKLGLGLLENAYEVCMAYELSKNLEVEIEFPMPLVYDEI